MSENRCASTGIPADCAMVRSDRASSTYELRVSVGSNHLVMAARAKSPNTCTLRAESQHFKLVVQAQFGGHPRGFCAWRAPADRPGAC